MRATLVLLVLLAFAVSASAATMTPMSDDSLSAVSATGGGGHHHSDSELLVETFIIDQGQQHTMALNLINAGGPVQVGNNALIAVAPGCVGILGATVIQAVVNLEHHQCAPCAFDEATLQTGVSGQGQQYATALNLINAAGTVQVGNNLIALMSCDGVAGVVDSLVVQAVVNGACQTTPSDR